jgi:hypothetical protein
MGKTHLQRGISISASPPLKGVGATVARDVSWTNTFKVSKEN